MQPRAGEFAAANQKPLDKAPVSSIRAILQVLAYNNVACADECCLLSKFNTTSGRQKEIFNVHPSRRGNSSQLPSRLRGLGEVGLGDVQDKGQSYYCVLSYYG